MNDLVDRNSKHSFVFDFVIVPQQHQAKPFESNEFVEFKKSFDNFVDYWNTVKPTLSKTKSIKTATEVFYSIPNSSDNTSQCTI